MSVIIILLWMYCICELCVIFHPQNYQFRYSLRNFSSSLFSFFHHYYYFYTDFTLFKRRRRLKEIHFWDPSKRITEGNIDFSFDLNVCA